MSSSAAASSHENHAEAAAARAGELNVAGAEDGVVAEASDWDETEIARAIALSLAGNELVPLGSALNNAAPRQEAPAPDALPHAASVDLEEQERAAADNELDARPALSSHGDDGVHFCADDYCIYDDATLTGGYMPGSPGQPSDGAAAAHGDDSILDISFQDDLQPKPVTKRKSRVASATAKQQKQQQPDAVEDVDFTPEPKRSRARTGIKASSAKVAPSEEDVSRAKAEALSRKSMMAAVKSARLGLLRPGVAAECRCRVCRVAPILMCLSFTHCALRLHVFVDTGVAASERGSDIISALQQVTSYVLVWGGSERYVDAIFSVSVRATCTSLPAL